jgi:uncharacterized protein (UPF0335 family)
MGENIDVTIEVPGQPPIKTNTDAIRRAADAAERRSMRSQQRMAEGMADAAELSQEMAAAGLIDQQAADETLRIAERAAEKLNGSPMKVAREQLRAFVDRIERLDEERKTITDDIRNVYAESKGNGFDVKALRTIVRMRKEDANKRQKAETILETYMLALGMI